MHARTLDDLTEKHTKTILFFCTLKNRRRRIITNQLLINLKMIELISNPVQISFYLTPEKLKGKIMKMILVESAKHFLGTNLKSLFLAGRSRPSERVT